MSLRMRLFLSLFLFALLPLIIAALINLPLVLERVELFYRAAVLENLRADFSDLDQHLASRDSSVRLLARLPEPGVLTGTSESLSQGEIDQARARYILWINRILGQDLDITRIVFVDREGRTGFWLERDSGTGAWVPPTDPPEPIPPDSIRQVMEGDVSKVTLSPVQVDQEAISLAQAVTLQLLAPIPGANAGSVMGIVAITIDISGLVQRDPNTLWAHQDGRYLHLPGSKAPVASAFADFPGLAEQFRTAKIAIWERQGRRVIWVPMFRTERGEPLWVGREVDLGPLKAFRSEIVVRVLAIILGLVLLLFFAVRIIVRRTEKITSELTEGIHSTLVTNQPVRFEWNDTRELRQLGDDLTRLSERHAAHTRSLRAHTRELEANNRYKSEFLANVSHELRTPLNSIHLLSKMLSAENSRLDEESRRQADVIHKASSDLKALIDDVLDLSRIEAGRLDLHCETVALRPVLEDLRELLLPQFQARALAFRLDIRDGVPGELVTDVDKVRQILKNFLSNALKFTREGAVTLQASLAEPPYALALTVSDTGIGIPADKQEKIFEAFKQADGSTARRYGGTGLGLTISRQLAGMLGGEIRLQSEPGKGASFTLLMPATQEAGNIGPADSVTLPIVEHDDSEDAPGLHAPVESQPRFDGRVALVLDCEVRSQLQIARLLEDMGMITHFAGDRDEAIETVEELGDLDLLLVDVLTPSLDACATISDLRGLAQHTAAVGLIREDTEEQHAVCRAAKLDDWLLKPVDRVQLLNVLDRCLPVEPGEVKDE